MTRPNEFRQIVFSILLVASTHTVACTAAPYLMPQFKRGETYADVYSKSVIVTGEGFEPIVQRFDGTSTYLVTDAGPRVLRFDETDVTAGRLTPTNGRLEIRNGGNTNCYNGSCFLNTQTSGLIFIPLLWGTPSGTLEKDQTWTVQIPQPWEIGPAGIETVTVVTVDSTTRVAILQRDGRGNGPSEDDMRGLPITVNGRSGHATVDAGPSHWKGQLVVRAGVVLSDVVVAERQVTLKVDTRVFTGHERVITTLTAAPPMQ